MYKTISTVFEGRTYLLPGYVVLAAGRVAMLYPNRHGYGAPEYADSLLRLAEELAVDCRTAERIAEWLFPNRRTLARHTVRVKAHMNRTLDLAATRESLTFAETSAVGSFSSRF